MKHLVWGILVLVYMGLIVMFPTEMTLITLFFGAFQVGSWANDIGKWIETKWKTNTH